MFIVGHAAAGALIGEQLAGSSPLFAFGMGFVSHFLLDLIPHGDRHHVVDYFHGQKKNIGKFYNELMIDALMTVIMVSVLMMSKSLDRDSVAWGIIGGVLPDLLVGLHEKFKSTKLKAFTKFHFMVHNALIHNIEVSHLQGTIVQLAVIIGMLAAIR